MILEAEDEKSLVEVQVCAIVASNNKKQKNLLVHR